MSDERPSNAPETRPNFPKMEEEIAAFWEKKNIFDRSIEERPESKTYVFYDGPPFGTGLPHYGHLLQSAIKDAVPRYFTMQGRRVPRRWGWDCHGLPVETLIEKDLKLNSKRDIESYGVDRFNEACRSSVLKYAGEWKRYVERIGRWVEFDDAYKTMDPSYTESVWWAFAELSKKGLLYKDLRVSFFCPRCSTPLSNFEIAMGNHYIDAEDPAVTVKFRAKGEPDTYFLSWTTTPWTLPANVALAVHPDQIYVKARMHDTGETYVFAEALTSSVLKDHFPLKDDEATFEIVAKMKGSELAGMAYEPLYPLADETFRALSARQGSVAYRVVPMGYVSVEEGTGIVHTAPAFGEDDFMASKAHDLPVLVTVDDEGRHRPEIALVAGEKIKDSDTTIVKDLEARGLLFRSERITHSVPVCWRCSTHLLYKAQPAWFVNVTKLKPKLLETAKKINWHPDHFKAGRFGKGLETAPDWCISRTRYWGAPLPVWTNPDGSDVRIFGSIGELETAAGVKIDRQSPLALHRPAIDAVTFTNDRGETMRRIPDVFDCWFESGSMPYASVHYPFENKQWFDANFPADFIAEGQDQTRGWFYNLHVLATALFGKPAFKDVVVTGLIMAEDGKKMSKSLKNYPDPWDVMSRLGADALRFYLLSSPVIQAEQLNFSERDVETLQRTLFGTLWNIRAFYLMYAEGETVEITKPRSAHVLDRWLMARLTETVRDVTAGMDRYDIVAATRPLRDWVDDLSTWWLRRSRERMKGENAYEKLDALRTLREALLETSLLFAPFAPFFADRLYQDMNGPKMSVHLDRWPKADDRLVDEQLLADMQWARDVAAKGHESRSRTRLPVRQALAAVTVAFRDASEAARLNARGELLQLLRDELNVERVALQGGVETGTDVWTVALDTNLTPELKKKGMARELVRRIMQMRKDLGLAPQDRVAVSVGTADHGVRDALESLAATLAKDVRAEAFLVGERAPDGGEARGSMDADGTPVEIRVDRA